MGTECQKPYTDEDKQLLDEAENATFDLPAGTIEKELPAIQAALEVRYDQMMEQKNTEFVQKAKEIIDKGESAIHVRDKISEIAKRDLESLRPVPAKATPEESKAKREAGQELGLSGGRWFGSPDIVRFPKESVKEVMAILNHPEMPRSFTRQETVGTVQYVNQQMIDRETGQRIRGMHQILMEKDEKTGETKIKYTIYVFANEKNECPKGKELKEILSHEIIHGPNNSRIEDYTREHPGEAAKAIASQAKIGPPSNYSLESTEEWVCECYRCYMVDQSKLSPGMVEFLKNISEYFSK